MNDGDNKTTMTNNKVVPQQTPPVNNTERNPSEALAKEGNGIQKLLSLIKLNKKTLIIIGVVFGIFIVLLILISVITKSVKNIVKPGENSSPTPTSEDVIINPQNVSTVSGELAPLQIRLIDLKNQINELDVNQSRLKPPDINFKIDFQPKK